MAHTTEMPPEGSEKNNRKPRPSTVYKRTIRSILSAVESAGYIAGCEEARAQLVEAAEAIGRKLELMKQAARTAKKAAKADGDMSVPDENKSEDALG